jgi:hypothetical protein
VCQSRMGPRPVARLKSSCRQVGIGRKVRGSCWTNVMVSQPRVTRRPSTKGRLTWHCSLRAHALASGRLVSRQTWVLNGVTLQMTEVSEYGAVVKVKEGSGGGAEASVAHHYCHHNRCLPCMSRQGARARLHVRAFVCGGLGKNHLHLPWSLQNPLRVSDVATFTPTTVPYISP